MGGEKYLYHNKAERESSGDVIEYMGEGGDRPDFLFENTTGSSKKAGSVIADGGDGPVARVVEFYAPW